MHPSQLKLRRFPLWLRLTIAITVAVIGIRTISHIAVSYAVEDRIERSFVHEQWVHVSELRRITQVDQDGTLRLRGLFSDPRYDAPNSGFYWQVSGDNGSTLKSASLANRNLPALRQSPGQAVRTQASGPTGPTLLVQQSLPGKGNGPSLTITVATDMSEIAREVAAINDVRTLLNTFAAVLAIPLVMLALFIAVGPLIRLRESIGRLERGEIRRIEDSFPVDVQPAVDQLNRALGHLEDLAEHCRFQAASVAHNVRGVLTSLLADLDDLAGRLEGDLAIQSIRDRCELIQRFLESHILRADRSTASLLNPEAVAIEPTLDRLFAALQRLHQLRQLDWKLAIGPHCAARCSPRDFGEIIFNLLDNAGRWAMNEVSCKWRIEDNQVVVLVEDDGPGFQPGSFPDIRKAPDRQKNGLGLGLEISRELCRLYGGEITLGQSARLGGAEVRVRLPLASLPTSEEQNP